MPHALMRWVRWLLVVEFVAAGVAKLAGLPAMVNLFAVVGLGQWFRYAVGTWEIAGAILLATPPSRMRWAGMLALSLLMVGAAGTEIFVLQRPPISSVGTLALLGVVAWPKLHEITQYVRQNAAVRVVTQLFRRVDS